MTSSLNPSEIPQRFRNETVADSERTAIRATQLAGEVDSTPHMADESLPPEPPRSQRIGRFEIRSVLGEGAFGTVYLAHDPQLDRAVALKVAKVGLIVRDSHRVRFLREARAAAQLRHPNIVPVYEFGTIEDINYIAYQYIRGRSLKAVLRANGKLPVRQGVEIIRKMAAALDYAHRQGVVHRDIKPDNVMMDEQGECHITDFGCARRDDGETHHTLDGSILGTPAYMSPEQAAGRSNQADGRSDVWSLGVMLEESLSGVLPFQGTLTQVLIQIREHEARPLRQIDPTLPRDLEIITQKCLAKKPEERFPTAQDLADELQRWERGEPILSRRISLLGRTWRWAKRHRTVASLLGVVFATLLAGITVSSYFAYQAIHAARLRAFAQVTSLRTASPSAVPLLIEGLRDFRQDVVPRMEMSLREPLPVREQARLRSALLSLQSDGGAVDRALVSVLLEDLLTAPPSEFQVIRDVLAKSAPAELETHLDGLWHRARDQHTSKSVRFRAAAALARYHQDAPYWPQVAADLVGQLVTENRLVITYWIQALSPVREHLLPHLLQAFRQGVNAEQRQVAAAVIAEMYTDRTNLLVELLMEGNPEQMAELLRKLQPVAQQATPYMLPLALTYRPEPEELPALGDSSATHSILSAEDRALRRKEASRLANVEIALAALGLPQPLWKRLGSNKQPATRTWIIQRAAGAGLDPQLLKNRLTNLQFSSEGGQELSGLLLALGQYGPGRLYLSERKALLDQLLPIYREHPHPGVHSACLWLLRKWGLEAELENVVLALEPSPFVNSEGGPVWYITPARRTMIAHPPVDQFSMGTEEPSAGRIEVQPRHARRIPRGFAIADRPVTVADFQQFEAARLKSLTERHEIVRSADDQDEAAKLELLIETLQRQPRNRRGNSDLDHPIVDINWYEAAAYCYWLGEQEGIPPEQQYYPSSDELFDAYMQSRPIVIHGDALEKTGYRLPTSAEWEFVCRAGTISMHPQGDVDTPARLPYSWTVENSSQSTSSVATRKPNDWGFFDLLGNTCDWCETWFLDTPDPDAEGVVIDGSDQQRGGQRELRGGSYKEFADELHSSIRIPLRPEQSDETVGFRVARTLPTNAPNGP